MPQRIDLSKLVELEKAFGDLQIGVYHDMIPPKDGDVYQEANYLTLRFGYWGEVDSEKMQSILGPHCHAFCMLVDDDPDCKPKYQYLIHMT
jgi:hypothetical protein